MERVKAAKGDDAGEGNSGQRRRDFISYNWTQERVGCAFKYCSTIIDRWLLKYALTVKGDAFQAYSRCDNIAANQEVCRESQICESDLNIYGTGAEVERL